MDWEHNKVHRSTVPRPNNNKGKKSPSHAPVSGTAALPGKPLSTSGNPACSTLDIGGRTPSLTADTVGAEKNLRTQLLRFLKRAGVKPWPKLFQNLWRIT